jgi:[ribosomal protein S5]-alanine N-acetyltransferase
MKFRRKVVAVVGDGANPYRERSILVGEWIAQSGYNLLTGGGGGVMEAVMESFVGSVGREGIAVGIIPGTATIHGDKFDYRTKGSAYPNYSTELAIFTHLPGEDPQSERSRNHINVLSADLVVALPGGAGTYAEIHLANKYGRPVVLFLGNGDAIWGRTRRDLTDQGFTVIDDFPTLMEAGNRILDPEVGERLPVRLPLEKCVIRSWRWNDAEELRRHANNREIWKNLHDGFPCPYTIRDARRWLAHALSRDPETAFAIEVDDQCVGGIGFVLKEGPATRTAEVGYWLGQTYWGRGITTDALRGLTAYVFENFPAIVRLYAQVFEWNTPSMRVLEKAGYTLECVMRKSAVKAGKVIDLAQYVFLR